MAYAPAPGAALRRNCTTVIPGHPSASPGVELIAVGEWCRAQGYDADVYGSGRLINEFGQKIASLLGKPAAGCMPSGTLAQQISLGPWSGRARSPGFGVPADG